MMQMTGNHLKDKLRISHHPSESTLFFNCHKIPWGKILRRFKPSKLQWVTKGSCQDQF